MTKIHTYGGIDYKIKRDRRNGRYITVPVELITSPVVVDQGTMVARTATYHNGVTNLLTWAVYLSVDRVPLHRIPWRIGAGVDR